MAALQYVDVPGYAAFLFRKSYADLSKPGALIDRSHQWLRGTDAAWNEQKKQWRFPSGAVLQFGYLDNEKDIFNYQGSEASFLGFDEATQFSEKQYRYLLSRVRRLKGSNVPMRVRCASNPGGVGHQWVRERFLIQGPASGRVFVPAKLEDNPHLDADEYEKSLAELDPVTRAQLRRGDWSVRDKDNALVPEWTDAVAKACTLDVDKPNALTPYVVGDLGSRDLTVWLFAWWDFERARLVVVDELVLKDPGTQDMATGLQAKLSEHFPESSGYESPRLFSDVDYRLVKDLRTSGITLIPTKKDDALGARNRARAMVGRGEVLISPRCRVLLLTLESAVWNDKRTDYQRAEGTGHADAWDALVYLVRNVDKAHNPVPPKAPPRVGEAWRKSPNKLPAGQGARELAAALRRKP